MEKTNELFHFNDKAVSYLQRGEYRKAAFWLQQALSSLRTHFLSTDDHETSSSLRRLGDELSNKAFSSNNHSPRPVDITSATRQYNSSVAPLFVTCVSLLERLPSGNGHRCCSRKSCSLSPSYHNNVFVVFNQAFKISSRCTIKKAEGTLPNHEKNLIVMILLYNTAVLHHNKGLLSGQSKELVQALHCYKLTLFFSFKVLPENDQKDDFGNIAKLLMAVSNNMGHIHSHFFNIEEARQCIKMLQDIVKTTATCLEKDDTFHLSLLIEPENILVCAPGP